MTEARTVTKADKPAVKIAAGVVIAAAGVGLLMWAASLWQIDGKRLANLAASQAESARLAEAKAALERAADESFEPPQILYGYYGDLDSKGEKTNISKETYGLRFAKSSAHVKGEVSGPVSVGGRRVIRKWEIQGYRRDQRIVLNIFGVPSQEDPTAKGVGTYYLAKTSADYTGTAIYLDCTHRVVQCPYALANEDINDDQARARWPKLFSKGCEKIDLTPDLASTVPVC